MITKNTFMKRLLPFILSAGFALQAQAQTISFLLPTAPCHNDGVLVANMAGFTPPLTVTWATEGTTGTNIVHTTTGLSDALTSYSGGPVTVYVSDATNSTMATYAGAPPFSYSISTTDAICPAPGTASVTATGGTVPYTYQWYNTATSATVGTGNSITQPSGNYGVVITDGSGCTYGSRVSSLLGHISYVSFSATLNATPASCTNGAITISAVDPTAVLPLSYSWSNGATTSSISGLSMGTYSVTITDASGCKAIDPTFVGSGTYAPPAITVTQTSTLSTIASSTPATCSLNDGSVSVTASGGMPPYSYMWSNGVTTASQTGVTAPGSYEVTVTDAAGCMSSNSVAVGATSTLNTSYTSTPSLCTSATGNATVFPTGGTPPYVINWYTTPAYTGPTATFLAPGEYWYKVTDATGCVRTGSARVLPLNIISTSFSSASATCATPTGTVTAMPAGGVAPYTYLWNTGSTSATLSGVLAGTYSVTVTDGMGCKTFSSYTVLSNSTLGVAVASAPASCVLSNDGVATATVYGGTAPFSYGWSSGGTTSVISGLPAGAYWVNVTDAAGCKASAYTYVDYDAANTSCYCTIQGTIFADTNSSCTQEPGEIGIPHLQVYCSGIGYTYTDAHGAYSFRVPSGSYTITENNPGYYPLSPCQANNISVSTTAGSGCVNTVNFANSIVPVHNITITTASERLPVPGGDYIQRVTISNEGTMKEDSIYASYKSDGQFFSPVFAPSTVFAGSGGYYTNLPDYTSLTPGASASFYVNYKVPANIAAGTNVSYKDSAAYLDMANYLTDFTPSNNINAYTTTVQAVDRANFTEVTPKGAGSPGYIALSDSVLTYTIHFRAPWTAENVTVIDTLDPNLDWTTLHPIYESSPCKVTVAAVGPNKIATFTFSNINLMPYTGTSLLSDGKITFSIETMPGLSAGTQIRNHASVMFDETAPQSTNSTLNTLTNNPVSVNNTMAEAANGFLIYPNPANTSFSSVINCTTPCNATMTVTDVTGKTMLVKTIALHSGLQTIATDINGFASGTYFVTVAQSDKKQTQKLLIIKQ